MDRPRRESTRRPSTFCNAPSRPGADHRLWAASLWPLPSPGRRAVGAVAQTKILRPDRTELHSAVPPGFRSQKLESPRVGKFDPTLQRSNFSTRLERLLVCAISGAALTTLQSHAQAITSIHASDPRLRDRSTASVARSRATFPATPHQEIFQPLNLPRWEGERVLLPLIASAVL